MQANPPSNLAARSKLKSSLPFSTFASAPTTKPNDAAGVAGGIGIAHDAANLMVALGLYCDLLSKPGVLREEHAHYAAELREVVNRSATLMQELLQGRGVHLPPMPRSAATSSDVAATLRAVSPVLNAIAGPTTTVTVRAPQSVLADVPSESIERILMNLVRNAAQAIESNAGAATGDGPAKGIIRITLTALAGHLQIAVEDNGPGMHVTTAASFLSPSPLEPGRRRGLGHRIVHELVTATGGTISMRVRPGKGTTFYLRWPSATVSPFGGALQTGEPLC